MSGYIYFELVHIFGLSCVIFSFVCVVLFFLQVLSLYKIIHLKVTHVKHVIYFQS